MGMYVLCIMDHKLKNLDAKSLVTLFEPLEDKIRVDYPDFAGQNDRPIGVEPPDADKTLVLNRWKAIAANEDVEPIAVNWGLGTVYVCRHCFVFVHNHNHKYRNLFHEAAAREILNVNRVIAQELGADEILYIPDGYFETAILENGPDEGKNTRQTIESGVALFGEPSPDINRGRANYFFVDDLTQSLESLQPYDDLPVHWVYDEALGAYLRPGG
jgi:hypothetical protein